MKRMCTVMLPALILLVALAGCSQQAGKQGPSIAVIDPQQVFSECDSCLKAGDYLKKIGTDMQDELKAAQADMQADPSDENKQKFQDLVANYQTKVQAEQQRVVNLLNDAFTDVLDTYRAENGFDVVLPKEGVVSFGEKSDITAAVVAALNARNVDLQLPEEGAEPAAETAAEPAAETAAETAKDAKSE